MTLDAILISIITALIASIGPTMMGYAAYIQARKAHDQSVDTAKKVDGQTHELMAAVQGRAGAEATLAEKDAERARQGDAAIAAAVTSEPAK